VPTIILVYRHSQDPITVSAGVVSLEDMEERIYRGMRLLAGEISPEEYSLYDFQRGGAFDVHAPAAREREIQGGR
jgi:conjugal transfer pilus assembly protein TraF